MNQYPSAIWSPSPSFNSGRSELVDRIVIHITDGQPNVLRCVESFQDRKNEKSAHFVIGQLGEIHQLVKLEDRAWHCKGWNGHSVGIEHVARTPREFKNWPELSERSRKKLLPDGIGWESATDPGFPLTEVQLKASAQLTAWLCKHFGLPIDREHIKGHCENPISTHKDCGRDTKDGGIFDWSYYMDLVIASM